MTWDKSVEDSFKKLLDKIPIFLRSTAETKVLKRAELILAQEGRSLITEKDLVDAFFKETPFGFHGPLKNDMQELGIDYAQYGYEK